MMCSIVCNLGTKLMHDSVVDYVNQILDCLQNRNEQVYII